jgi:hypothetical protein
MKVSARHLIRNQGRNLLNDESIPLRRRMRLAESRFSSSPSPACHPQPNQQGNHQKSNQRKTEQHLKQRESSRISLHGFS